MSKPREYWIIDETEVYSREQDTGYVRCDQVHVIEKSAYDELQKISRRNADLWIKHLKNETALEAKLKIAIDALRVIGPLARDNGNGETEYKSDAYGFIFKKVKETLDKIENEEAK